jgi:uncharacterized membrane protein
MLNKPFVPDTPLRGAGGLRIQSLDIARGFTVLIMPSIHVAMIYSNPNVQYSALGMILAFIAELPGAQLFMLIMGISFSLSSRINKKYVFQRAFYLLIAAYTLNILKFIIPLLFGWMPQNLLSELHLTDQRSSVIFFFLLGDILHFAAIAYLLLYFIYRLKNFQYWSLAFVIIITFISPAVWDSHTGIAAVDYTLQLIGGHPPNVFFPLFPWLVYPVAGLSLGYFLHRFDNKKIFVITGWIGTVICFITLLFPATPETTAWLPFYRTVPVDTFFHLGFVLVWISIINWLSRKISDNPFFKLLTFCSRNITSIYFIQWILVFWFIGFAGYQTIGFSQSVSWMILITAITLLLSWLLKFANGK